MDIDQEIESIASAHESVERGRWAVWEAFHDLAARATSRNERGEVIRRIGRRVGTSPRMCRVWLRAVRTVPAELRLGYVHIGTILWATQNLAPDECAGWLERVHDEGLTLKQLQVLVGKAEEVNANTPTLRRILRSIAKDAPDEPLDLAEAGEIERALRDVIQAGGTPVCGV